MFGIGAVASTVLHPVYGWLVNRAGSRRLTMLGLVLVACLLPLLSLASSYRSAIAIYVICAAAISMIITPSLAYMAEATSSAGAGSFGVGYGLYNVAWGAGLLGGPALGGFLFERMGFGWLMLMWAPPLLLVTWLLGKSTIAASHSRGARMKPIRAVTVLALTGLSPVHVLDSRRRSRRREVACGVRRHARAMFNMFGGKAAREGVTSTSR